MHTAIQPKETFFHYTHLKEEEIKDPLSAIHYFAGLNHLQNIRRHLWDWLVVALSAENNYYETADARWELLHLYDSLQVLMEAAYLVEDRNITLANCMVKE